MSSTGKLSREEFRRQKDLDAARKAGTAPAELDDEGNAINPHIPQFMAKAPWYLDTGKPGLKHQRKLEDKRDHVKFGDWYQRGQRDAKVATKYRKGACENCGAMSHKAKDCLERPRKKGAKWTGKSIAADEMFEEVKGVDNDYEAKRDRWNGYDPTEHKHVIKEYEAVEEMRRKMREEEVDKQTSTDATGASATKSGSKGKKAKESGMTSDGDFGSSDSDEEDEDKYAEKADMVGQKVDTDKRISVRNLRIREDRAKYLYNLDTESAYYDPKSRSMREAPNPSIRPEDAQYAGDNFERSRGEVAKMQDLQSFAWQSEARGNDVHMQANPTVNELQHREYQQKKEKLNQQIKQSIMDRYGGAEHFSSVPKELLNGQSESYVQYTATGQPIYNARRQLGASGERGDSVDRLEKRDNDEKPKVEEKKVRYDGNHERPFGSWTDPTSGKAGYECCYSTVKNSYCTGVAGRQAVEASDMLSIKPKATQNDRETEEVPETKGKRRSRRSRSSSYSSDSFSSASDSDDSRASSAPRSRTHKRQRKHAKGFESRKEIGEGDVGERIDKRKLKDALRAEDRRLRDEGGASKDADQQKPDWLKEAESINARNQGKYRSLQGDGDEFDITEEQLEAYRMKNRNRTEDPMANYRDEEE